MSSPDEVAGLLEALGAEVAAVGELGLRLQLHGLVLDLADAIPLRRRLGEDPLRHRRLLAGVLRQLRRLLLGERDDLQAPPLWLQLRVLVLVVFVFLFLLVLLLLFLNVLTIQTYDWDNRGLLARRAFWGERIETRSTRVKTITLVPTLGNHFHSRTLCHWMCLCNSVNASFIIYYSVHSGEGSSSVALFLKSF